MITHSHKNLFLLIALYQAIHSSPKEGPYKLESDALRIFDGTSSLDAESIRFMLFVYQFLKKIVIGEGRYVVQGVAYNLKDLEKVERAALAENNIVLLQEIQQALRVAKSEFIVETKEYLEMARIMKGMTLDLITQSCIKRRKTNSFLLKWADETDGTEMSVFEQEITTVHKLLEFCMDLSGFLTDMIHSCPKAKRHFDQQYGKK